MLLMLYLLLVHISLGSSFSLWENVCYGDTYNIPSHFITNFSNETITYAPKVGDPKIVVSNGQSLDPRFKVTRAGIKMLYLSERDNGATLFIQQKYFKTVIRLSVTNCRSVLKKLCGSFIYMRIPDDAEYLEFGPYVDVPPSILWNRTSESSIRGKVSGSDYEIKDITQKDSGYYRFRGSKDQLLNWNQYIVEEHVRSYNFDEGDIKLEYPITFTPAQVKFKRTWASKAKTVSESDGRFKITNSYLAIDYATPEDAGTYDFLDKDGNRILQITLEVREVEKVWVSVVVLAAISCGFILCCCCMKKHCCEESSDKTNGPESETEAPAPSAAAPSVYHNGTQTTEPVTPLLSREPRVVFPDPPTYDEAGGHIDPPPPYEECDTQPSSPLVPTYSSQQDAPPVPAEPIVNSSKPTVSAAGAAEPTTFTINTFDSDPHFELRGSDLLSMSPLNSDGSNTAQYNSDKFNF